MAKAQMLRWVSVFTRAGFPYFILSLGAEGFVRDMKRIIGWGYRDQLFVNREGIQTSYYSVRDYEDFARFIAQKDDVYVVRVNRTIRRTFNRAGRTFRRLKVALRRDYLNPAQISQLLTVCYHTYRECYAVYRFTALVDTHAGHLRRATLDDCARTKDVRGRFFLMMDATVLKDLSSKLAEVLHVRTERVLFMNYHELQQSLRNSRPALNQHRLERRYQLYILRTVNSETTLLTGKRAAHMYRQLRRDNKKSSPLTTFRGQIAHRGGQRIVGRVRVAYRAQDLAKIKKGMIVVTPMTTMQFTPLLRGVKALITDEGGITCHAAIISRELGIPCIIGTKIATEVLKDGDQVEVNANHGVVKVLQRAR